MKKLILLLLTAILVIIFNGCASKSTLTLGQAGIKNSLGTVAVNKAPAVSNLIPCASTASTPPEKIAELTTTMDTYQLDQSRSNSTRIKTNTRIFSLADLADSKANPIKDYRNPVEKTTLKEDVFYYSMKVDPNSPIELTCAIQICDQNNMTASSNELIKDPYITGTKTSLGVFDSLQDLDRITNGLPTVPGDYRIDAYTYTNGKWTLTNRIDKITFTK